ncbi:MAG: SDR family oxidoreductase [Candidatus Eisenbacteria bacterium]|nr:SDR family oxidoreductase [Candidatus Eisenbacteria bacterium]
MLQRCLVTGGAGFIGSNLVERLLADGASVKVLDNFSTGRRCNLDFARAPDVASRLEVLEGDIRDLEACRAAARGVEVVFHQAALPSVQRSVEDPVASHQVNATGSLHVLQAAREAGARRVVYASSSSVYGENPALPKTEEHETRPMSPYAISKLAGEQYARVFHQLYGFEAVALRYFNVFGPRQDPDSHYSAVIPRFIRRLLSGDPPDIYGDGEQSRDFTYVANVVEANLKAATAADAPGRAFNIALGGRVSLNELLRMLAEILGVPARARHLEARKGDIRHSQAGIELAREVLGYRGEVSLEEGLRRTVEHFRSPSRTGS